MHEAGAAVHQARCGGDYSIGNFAGEKNSMTPEEWKRLPKSEKDRLRAAKHQRRRDGLVPVAAAQATELPRAAKRELPFVLPNGRTPIDLSFVGASGPCFIMLSGPSLAELDISQLALRGAYTIAVNNAATLWRPNAWTCVDPPMKFHNAIWTDPGVLKICPQPLLNRVIRHKLPSGRIEGLRSESGVPVVPSACPNTIGYRRNPNFTPENYLSEPSINWGTSKKWANRLAKRGHPRPRILNVMLAVLKIAYSLGFRHVFLLGCDFAMQADRCYAFDELSKNGKAESNNNAYRVLSNMLTELLPHFQNAGFNVYNCNPKSNLRVFPFVGFDDAIRSATAHVPQDPLDSVGWYDKS
jgi:hypothetical protein